MAWRLSSMRAFQLIPSRIKTISTPRLYHISFPRRNINYMPAVLQNWRSTPFISKKLGLEKKYICHKALAEERQESEKISFLFFTYMIFRDTFCNLWTMVMTLTAMWIFAMVGTLIFVGVLKIINYLLPIPPPRKSKTI